MIARYCCFRSASTILVAAHWPTIAHGPTLLFVQGKRINIPAVAGLRRRPEIEDPYNSDHGEQNETGSRCFFFTARRIYQSVDGRSCENQSSGEETHDSDLVRFMRVGRYHYHDTYYTAKHICYGPPCKVRKGISNIGYDGCDECDQPRKCCD